MVRRMMAFVGLALAVVLVVAALATWQLTRLAESRHPPIGSFLAVDGARLHYADSGSGPALVMLHGAGANLLDFETSLVPRLGDRYRVIRVDRPGSGYSTIVGDAWPTPAAQAGAVLQLLDVLEIDESVWIGHSWGGAVVMAGLLEAPERVRAGVLLAGAAYPWAGGVDLTDRMPAWPVIGPLVTHTLLAPLGHLLLDTGVRTVFAPNEPVPGYRDATGVALYLRPRQFAATGRDIAELSPYLEAQATRYAAIRQPLLLVHGMADDIVPAWNHADRLQRVLPATESLRLPATGHAPHHTHADRIARRIDAFAARSLAPAASGDSVFTKN